MSSSKDTSHAALVLVILMQVIGLADFGIEFSRQESQPVTTCSHPEEMKQVEGSTVSVHCREAGALLEEGSHHALRGPARLLYGLKLDLNRTNAAALETLPRIGPARAVAILQHREKQPFQSVDDLRNVSGIGPVTMKGLRPYLMVHEGEADESG